jgi:hypothetical protein
VTAQEKARDAIYEAIVQRTKSVAWPGDKPDAEVDKLADAYAKVTFGPQGGALTNDAHSTTHRGEDQSPPAGFKPSAAPSDVGG